MTRQAVAIVVVVTALTIGIWRAQSSVPVHPKDQLNAMIAEPDIVELDHSDQAWVLVSGQRGSDCETHQLFVGIQEVPIGNWAALTKCDSALTVFAIDHGMFERTWKATDTSPWSDSGGDRVSLSNLSSGSGSRYGTPPIAKIKMTLWIVNNDEADALNGYAVANSFFNGEAPCGFELTIQRKIPVDIATWFKQKSCDDKGELYDRVATEGTEATFNVFYGLNMDGPGESCPMHPNVAFVARNAFMDTLAHELGHSVTLRDSEIGVASNLMSSGTGQARNFITFGQCYRANVIDGSIARLFVPPELVVEARSCDVGCIGLSCPSCPKAQREILVETPVSDSRVAAGCLAKTGEQLKADRRRWLTSEELDADTSRELLGSLRCDEAATRAEFESAFALGPSPIELANLKAATTRLARIVSGYRARHGVPQPDGFEDRFVKSAEANYRALFKIRVASAFRLIPSADGLQFLRDRQSAGDPLDFRVDVAASIAVALNR